MIADTKTLEIASVQIEVTKKPIKNLHLAVYPPDGRVTVASPKGFSDELIRVYILSKISWIRKQQLKFTSQDRLSGREYINGESHYFQGRRYLLEVDKASKNSVHIVNNTKIKLLVTNPENKDLKEKIMLAWYRTELKSVIIPLIEKWEKIIGVKSKDIRIKSMKTRWGSCNIKTAIIWLNLELAKKSKDCVEYVLVHELTHLLEKKHNANFKNLMGRFLPDWISRKVELNTIVTA
jgi:predicted metal-dependent hydrolase